MAYIAPNPLDRIAVGDDIYKLTDLGGGLVRLTPQPTIVTEAGTPINRALLKPAFDTIQLHDTKIAAHSTTLTEYGTELYTNIPADITNAISANETAKGGWNTIIANNFNTLIPNNGNTHLIPIAPSRFAISWNSGYIVAHQAKQGFGIASKNEAIIAGVRSSIRANSGVSYPGIYAGSFNSFWLAYNEEEWVIDENRYYNSDGVQATLSATGLILQRIKQRETTEHPVVNINPAATVTIYIMQL